MKASMNILFSIRLANPSTPSEDFHALSCPRNHRVGACGVRLQPLVDALKAEMLGRGVLNADETPVQMLKPDKGATHRVYLKDVLTRMPMHRASRLGDLLPHRVRCADLGYEWRLLLKQ